MNPFTHKCRYSCNENFTENDRQEIFDNFWQEGNFDRQNLFLLSCVQILVPKRPKADAAKPKSASRACYLNGKRVCREFLLRTLDISHGRFNRLCEKVQASPSEIPSDKRGKHGNRNRIPKDAIQYVKNHISSFPTYMSHYSRVNNPNKRYLSPGLSLGKMYQLYCEHCAENNVECVKEWCYRRVFNTDFNLSFHHPRSDTCNKCDMLHNLITYESDVEKKQELQFQMELHQRKAELARHIKQADMNKHDESSCALSFHLQKTLPTPCLTSNRVYYSRQLWVYNLGIHTNIGRIIMNVWDETVASRGSREVGSCLLDFATDLPLGVTKLIAWSDSCGGQNKNCNIPRYWMTILQNTHITQVDHKFLEPGHTYLENDEDFGIIERQKRRQQLIYTPDDWRQLIRSSSRHFQVTDMTQDKFVNTDTLDCMLYVPKKNGEGIPIKWREIRWMRFESSAPTCMQYKTTLQDEVAFSSVNFRRATRGRQAANLLPPLQPLYREPRNISKLKWKDLQSLKMFIPPVHHEFYDTLAYETHNAEEAHPDLVESYCE